MTAALRLAAAAAVLALLLSGCGTGEFNDWASDCVAAGGVVGVTYLTWWGGERYECFVDGELVTLPGWEGY